MNISTTLHSASSSFDCFHRDSCFKIIPIESIAFLIASVAASVFSHSIAAVFLGIALSIATTKLVLKAFDCYDRSLVVNVTKEICKFNKKHPKLQLIAFLFALAIGFASKPLGLIAGAFLGSFGSIVLDVESYRLMQQTNRRVVPYFATNL